MDRICESENAEDSGLDSGESDVETSSTKDEEAPLLQIPPNNATIEEWESAIPLHLMPALPARDGRYWREPWAGIGIVGGLSAMLVATTISSAMFLLGWNTKAKLLVAVILTWALIACSSTAFLIFGRASEVKRSPQTCYPIPTQVVEKLIHGEKLTRISNIRGADGTSFCTRCLVWRPKVGMFGPSHHCRICQRCVTNFDHHCGVFGRCIVGGNMPCFMANFAMLILGGFTAVFAFLTAETDAIDAGAGLVEHVSTTVAAVIPTTLAPTFVPIVQ